MVKTNEQVLADIQAILEKSAGRCVDMLKPVVKAQPESGQIFAFFEMFHRRNYSMTYNAFLVRDGELSPIGTEVTPNASSLVQELNDYIDKITWLMLHEWTDEDGAEFARKHKRQLLKWFTQCWKKAGGEKSAVPTFFCFGKETAVHKMLDTELISVAEAARKLHQEISL